MKLKKDSRLSLLILFSCLVFIFFQNKFISVASKEIDQKLSSEILTLHPAPSIEQKVVIVFVTSWCGQCKSLIKELNKNGIIFELYDIEQDSQGQELYMKIMRSNSGPVPVTLVGSHVFVGNQAKAIMQKARETNKKLT